jgi:predicted phosphodiesterase
VSLILAVNDIHATRRPPSSCTGSYWPDLLNLLHQTVGVARERGASAVVWAGDVLHHKEPRRTDHGLMQDLIRVIQAHPCPLFIVPGNHDLRFDRLDSIEDTQPLGVLYLAGARRLEGWADDAEGALEFPLYGVPWQQQWSREALGTALRGYTDPTGGEWNRPVLVVAHAPLYPPGREPGYEGAEFTPASWWADAMGGAGHLLYGHIHEPHGVWRYGTGKGVTFCNFGALSRGSLDEYNLEREVGAALWDSETGGFEFVPLKARPASEVFRLAEHEQAVTAQRRMDGFRAAVSAVTLGVLSVESVIAHIRTLGVGRPVENLAEELLTAQLGGTR